MKPMSKKSFKLENPVMHFITPQPVDTEEHQPTKAETVPEGFKMVYVETKSKHVHFLLKPSVFDALAEYAKRSGESKNELVNQAIAEFLEKRA